MHLLQNGNALFFSKIVRKQKICAETKQQIVDFIYVKMPEETDNELLAIMIVVLQDLTKMKFGLKEDSNSGIISGNVTRAVNKVLKMIEK